MERAQPATVSVWPASWAASAKMEAMVVRFTCENLLRGRAVRAAGDAMMFPKNDKAGVALRP